MIAPVTKPTQWHRRPDGRGSGPCPICGVPNTRIGEHRAIAPDEPIRAKWIRRFPKRGAWNRDSLTYQLIHVTERRHPRGYKINRGPTKRVRRIIQRATRMLAEGKDLETIIIELGVSSAQLQDYQNRLRRHWQAAYQRAVRSMESPPEKDQSHVATDGRPEVWARKRQIDMTENGLADFFYKVYLPSQVTLSEGQTNQILTAIRQFNAFVGQPILIWELTDDLVTAFLRSLVDRYSPTTINTRRGALLALWRCAWRKRWHNDLPRDVPKLKAPRRTPTAWTKEEVERLIDHCRQLLDKVGKIPRRLWWPAFLLTIWDTGLRVGTLLRAEVGDVNLTERWFLMRGELGRKQTHDQLYRLNTSTVRAIASMESYQRTVLFPWPYGTHYLWRYFRRIVEDAGLVAERTGMGLFHKLRRSVLTAQATVGGIGAAQRLAGHARPEMTLARYIDPRIFNPHATPPPAIGNQE